MEMIELMGGSPVPMASSETYTSLQQGIVDGAENTELALTVDKHEEIVKSYDGFCEWEDRGNIFESRIMLRYLL